MHPPVLYSIFVVCFYGFFCFVGSIEVSVDEAIGDPSLFIWSGHQTGDLCLIEKIRGP